MLKSLIDLGIELNCAWVHACKHVIRILDASSLREHGVAKFTFAIWWQRSTPSWSLCNSKCPTYYPRPVIIISLGMYIPCKLMRVMIDFIFCLFVFRASERRRYLILFVLMVTTSVAISLIVFGTAFSITISRLGVSDLNEALVQLNFTSTLHRMEINESLAAKHHETAESLANSLNLMASNVAQLQHQVKVILLRMNRSLKIEW